MEEYCGAFAVQKPVTTPKTKDKAKFDLIHDFAAGLNPTKTCFFPRVAHACYGICIVSSLSLSLSLRCRCKAVSTVKV